MINLVTRHAFTLDPMVAAYSEFTSILCALLETGNRFLYVCRPKTARHGAALRLVDVL
jgi:hypothetical protein